MTAAWRCAALFLVSCSLAVFAFAADRDTEAEKKIEQQLEKTSPLLVERFRRATSAMDAQKYAEAARDFDAICTIAANFDAAHRRLGWCLAKLGRSTEGRAHAEKAVAINRSAANLCTLADVLLLSAPTQQERQSALALLREASGLPDGNDAGTWMRIAQVSLQTENYPEARAAVSTLITIAPQEPGTHYFAAVVAAIDEHWIQAQTEILKAKELGLDPTTVQQFLDSGIGFCANAWRFVRGTAWVVVVWAAGLSLLFVLGFALSRTTLKQIDKSDVSIAVNSAEQRLRRIYRTVLNVAGVYYYLSLPIVVVLVLGIAASIIFAFFAIGTVPIKLVALIAIGALVTVWNMGRSLFLRVKTEDPGRPLTRNEAEALWLVAEEVARDVRTRPVDEIRLTPGTDLCVYERGTWREKLQDKATRVLVLGAAVLNDFKEDDFRCVLAHEYGHFSNRDTAGGDVALRVRNDMMKFYYAMAEAGQATWLNVAFHFLRMYNFVFRRISHGATRLQEVLADRVAAQAYGPQAFEGGLRHAIRRSIEFDEEADREIKQAIDSRRAVRNLYEIEPSTAASIAEQLDKALNRPTTEDDTHPSPRDRFRLIARIPKPERPVSSRTVWELFADRDAIVREMMDNVEKNVARHRGEPIITESVAPAA